MPPHATPLIRLSAALVLLWLLTVPLQAKPLNDATAKALAIWPGGPITPPDSTDEDSLKQAQPHRSSDGLTPAEGDLPQRPDLQRPDDGRSQYEAAFAELRAMLDGRQDLSFKRAVFLTENAYFDGKLSWEGFNNDLASLAGLAQRIGEATGEDWQQDTLLRNWSVFTLMTDTLPVVVGSDTLYHLPYTYQVDDFNGQEEWANMFVTKLLATHRGNCHSLPYLYKILAEELGAKAWLALAPNHIYIKHRTYSQYSFDWQWFNIELTSGSFPIDGWLMASGYIATDAIRNGMYLDTLSQTQALTQVLVDLAKGYERKYGLEGPDRAFVWNCIQLALKHHPGNINARLLEVETLRKTYQAEPSSDLLERLGRLIGPLIREGYREMPDGMYLDWLFMLRSGQWADDDYPRRYDNRELAPPDYDGPIGTVGGGRFKESYHIEPLMRVGSIMYNTERETIAYLMSPDTLWSESRLEPEVTSRWFSIDPKAHEFFSWSPYNYALNNPVLMVDPDGMAAEPANCCPGICCPIWTAELQAWGERNNIGTRLIGGLRMLGGGAEAVAGGALVLAPEPTITKAGGVAAIVHGGDQFSAGLQQMISGETEQSLTERGLVALGATDQEAAMMDGAIGMGLTAGAGYAANSGNGMLRAGTSESNTAAGAYREFDTFDDLKTALGPAGEGKAWHHIVEQNPTNVAQFGGRALHNTNNVLKLEHGAGSIHARISGYYSSKQPFTGGQTVREWLNSKPYEFQRQFGLQKLKEFGWSPN